MMGFRAVKIQLVEFQLLDHIADCSESKNLNIRQLNQSSLFPHLEPEMGVHMPFNSELCFGFGHAWPGKVVVVLVYMAFCFSRNTVDDNGNMT